jgi:hypothetical protein
MSKPLDSIDDVYENPADYGAPTFEEFKRNREKYMGRDDDALASVSAGGEVSNRFTQKHVYEIEGYRCKTLEEVERIASQQGIPLRSLDFRAMLIPQGAGKGNLLIKFVSSDERKRRESYR